MTAENLADVRVEAERTFWQWVDEYVVRPHPEIGRDGPVCPFVPRLVEAGTLFVEVEESLDGTDAAAMEARMREAVSTFEGLADPKRSALVVLFPRVARADAEVADRVQEALKPECVPRGLMIGQFHPLSEEPGARNPAFPANRAPIVAIALRHMSHHDIVFLYRSAEMFHEYDARYADTYADDERELDPFLVARYEEAAARFGGPDAH